MPPAVEAQPAFAATARPFAPAQKIGPVPVYTNGRETLVPSRPKPEAPKP